MGGLTALAQSIMGSIISPRDRGRYSGYMGAVMAVSTVSGPLLGGVIVDSPLGLALVLLRLRAARGHLAVRPAGHPARRDRAPRGPHRLPRRAADLRRRQPAAALGHLRRQGLRLVSRGRPPPTSARPPSAVALAVVVELKVPEPLVPLRVLRNRTAALVIVASVAVGIAMFGGTTFLGQYFQVARGYSPTHAGLLTIPLMAGLLLSSTGRRPDHQPDRHAGRGSSSAAASSWSSAWSASARCDHTTPAVAGRRLHGGHGPRARRDDAEPRPRRPEHRRRPRHRRGLRDRRVLPLPRWRGRRLRARRRAGHPGAEPAPSRGCATSARRRPRPPPGARAPRAWTSPRCRRRSGASCASRTATPPASIFVISAVVAVVALLCVVFIKEVPLRTTVRIGDTSGEHHRRRMAGTASPAEEAQGHRGHHAPPPARATDADTGVAGRPPVGVHRARVANPERIQASSDCSWTTRWSARRSARWTCSPRRRTPPAGTSPPPATARAEVERPARRRRGRGRGRAHAAPAQPGRHPRAGCVSDEVTGPSEGRDGTGADSLRSYEYGLLLNTQQTVNGMTTVGAARGASASWTWPTPRSPRSSSGSSGSARSRPSCADGVVELAARQRRSLTRCGDDTTKGGRPGARPSWSPALRSAAPARPAAPLSGPGAAGACAGAIRGPWRGRCGAGQLQQPLDAVAVAGVGLEQLGQPVVVDLAAGQRPADVLGHVVVAEADRVGVAQGALVHLRRGPHPHPGYGAQPARRVRVAERGHRLEAPGRGGGAHAGRGPGAVDAGGQPLPGRDPGPGGGVGRHPQPVRRRPRRAPARRSGAPACGRTRRPPCR